MRPIVALRRSPRALAVPRLGLLARAGLVALMAGGLILSATAPAHADPPEVTVEQLCGAFEVRWTVGDVIGGEERWATTVWRNDVLVEEFDMFQRGSIRYGASDGDRFLVRRAGLPDLHYLYEAPADCADPPALEVLVGTGCDGLHLALTNRGPDPLDGLVLLLPGTEPDGAALGPVAPGTTEVPVALTDGDGYALITGPLGPGAVYWLIGVYARPAGCATPAPAPSTPEPSTPDPATPEPGDPGEDGDPGAGGGLPVTGSATLTYAAGGLLLVAAGLVVVTLTRRRRLRFPAGE